jgi:hypothetical protein
MIELTDEQMEVTLRYIVAKMQEAKINPSNPMEIVKFMILNPLPDHTEVAREDAEATEKERQRRIVLLTEELAKLEGN